MEERQIKLDEYNNVLLSKEEGRTALLYGQNIVDAFVTDEQEVELFNKHSEQILGVIEKLSHPIKDGTGVQEYHNSCVAIWNIPEFYKTLNVESLLLAKCKTDVEIERVNTEYAMFEERELIPLLQYLIFIVGHMRDENIVWGVGRGSSVASYCLYLLDVHKVDSIKYDLPIEEFLK